MEVYDLIIIGVGPAGLAAGLYASRRNLKTLVIGKMLGGQMSYAPSVENYPGLEPTHGIKMAEKMRDQAKSFGCEVKMDEVVELTLAGDVKKIKTKSGEYLAKTVLIATGSHYRKLDAEGESKFIGKGVSYCAICDGPLFKGKKIAVIGGSDSAVKSALYLSEIASEIFMIHRRGELRAEEANQDKLRKSKVKMIWNSVVEKIDGDNLVRKITIKDVNTDERKEMEVDGVFVEIGEIPTTEIMKAAGVEVNDKNFINVDGKFQTNVPGVFAAGDVTGSFAQIIVAAAGGAEAATSAYMYLKGIAGDRKPADYSERK
ncbi:MAG: thioredoxin-disulfide reductase [Candidatus Aenigmatarchaeota archaeon]